MAIAHARAPVIADDDVPVAHPRHCAEGLHVARLGSPCACGDSGPLLRPRTPIVLGPERKLSYTAPH